MKFYIFLALVYTTNCGIIEHDHERATSFQNIHIEHFHPIPTFIKKEHKELLEHPVALGTSSSKVEIHHGGKHDHGYAFANVENNVHGHAFGDFESSLAAGGHGDALSGSYQVHDQGEEYAQYQDQLGHAAALGNYELSSGLQNYANVEAHGSYDAHDS